MGAAKNSPPVPVHWRVRRRKQQRQVLLIALSALMGLGGLALGSWLRSAQLPPPVLKSASCEVTAPPLRISVEVHNGTERPGLADRVATDLERRDIGVSGIANASKGESEIAKNQTAVIFIGRSANQQLIGKSLARIMPGAKISEVAGQQDPVIRVVLGRKFQSLARPEPTNCAGQPAQSLRTSTVPSS